MVDKNDTLLREVDEELRREQMQKLWDKYGTYVLVAAGAFVLLVGGYKYMEASRIAAAQSAGAQYEAAYTLLDAGKTDEALAALKAIADSGTPGYGALSELSIAGQKIKTGKTAEALEAFERLAKSGSADALMSSFAALQAAAIRLGDADFTEMQNRLTPLAADGQPWRYYARELLGAAALKAGKLSEARSALMPLLGEKNTPQGTLERVNVMMSAIAAAELEKSAPAQPAAPASVPAEADPAASGAAPASEAKPAEPPK